MKTNWSNPLITLSDIAPGYNWARLEEFGLPQKKLKDAIAASHQTKKPLNPGEVYNLLKHDHRFRQAVDFARYPTERQLMLYLQVLRYPAHTGGTVLSKRKMARINAEASLSG